MRERYGKKWISQKFGRKALMKTKKASTRARYMLDKTMEHAKKLNAAQKAARKAASKRAKAARERAKKDRASHESKSKAKVAHERTKKAAKSLFVKQAVRRSLSFLHKLQPKE